MSGTCEYCGKGELKEIRRKVISGTIYRFLKCDNCKKEVARSD